ncbi:hypothetical protein M0638_03055 [Roseomonas sp. NAR14]|uniref:Uncharacterized protein n=1 Tax=Roseomonas acroporae TaxID=2937791 RepID=A0A9X1YB96_9PROT|nr:hypothetical protein [Roseomonas acroporae]MCK8783361.1 hypothetical protein [Roseomonas acroporae]
MPDSIFADGMLDANVSHGVVRINLGQAGPEGKVAPAGQLIMPLAQVPSLINGLVQLMKQVEARMKEAQASQQPTAAEPTAAMPSTFRFS